MSKMSMVGPLEGNAENWKHPPPVLEALMVGPPGVRPPSGVPKLGCDMHR
jgi:hypothetical protein